MKLCGFEVGVDRPFFLIAGPCVIESEALCLDIAFRMKEITEKLGIPYIFKASFDKANRTSATSFRGRQTDFIRAVAQSGKPVNIKKGQFLAPHDMARVVEKAKLAAAEAGLSEDRFMVCERGASFGYGNLVSDMRSLAIMRETRCPVVFDATHSVQLPGGQGSSSGGERQFVPVLARAAVAVGVAGIFMETHPNPEKALSDGPNSVPLGRMPELLATLTAIDRVVKQPGMYLEEQFS